MAKETELKHFSPANYEQQMYGELLKTLVDQNDTIIEQNEKIIKALSTKSSAPAPTPKSTEKTAKTDTKDSNKE